MKNSHEIGQSYSLAGMHLLIVDYLHDQWIVALQKEIEGVLVQYPFVPIREVNLTNFTDYARKGGIYPVGDVSGSIAKWEEMGHAHFIIDVEEIWDMSEELLELTPEYLKEVYIDSIVRNQDGVNAQCMLVMPPIYPARLDDVDLDNFTGFYRHVDREIGGDG